jgi:hypothetical protein
MPEKDITRINVGDFAVGIVGLRQAIEEMAIDYADKPDEEVRAGLLERLKKDNYLPSSSMEDYGKAFVREFRKFLGQPYQEELPRRLEVKVLGAGCNRCHSLTQTIMELLTELHLPAGVDHITDLQEIARHRVMGSPALVINGKVMAVGSVPPRDRIKQWLMEANASLGKC